MQWNSLLQRYHGLNMNEFLKCFMQRKPDMKKQNACYMYKMHVACCHVYNMKFKKQMKFNYST